MKKVIAVIFVLLTITLNYANDFSYEKINESYIIGTFDTQDTPIYNDPYIYFGSSVDGNKNWYSFGNENWYSNLVQKNRQELL